MKTSIRLLSSLLGVALVIPFAHGEQSKKLRVLADAKEPGAKIDRRVLIHHGGDEHEKETVAFLGVETAPVSPELTAQLNLPREAGLVVRHVVAGSPAESVLKAHDVLLKLDDQLLIEPRQFAVLIRNRKEGDEVTLTYLRGGKEATAKVKLAKHDVPKTAFLMNPEGGRGVFNFEFGGSDGAPELAREKMDRVLSLLDQHHGSPGAPVHGKVRVEHHGEAGPGFKALTVNTGNSNMVFTDEEGSLEVTIKDGKKTLVAKNTKGEQLYSGPIDTPEQHEALPAGVRERLGKLEGMQEFSFETDEDFGDNVKFVHPGTKIALPLSPEPSESTRELPPPQAF